MLKSIFKLIGIGLIAWLAFIFLMFLFSAEGSIFAKIAVLFLYIGVPYLIFCIARYITRYFEKNPGKQKIISYIVFFILILSLLAIIFLFLFIEFSSKIYNG